MSESQNGNDGASNPPNSRWRFAGLQSYEDEDGLVVSDRENSRAWIRSEITVTIQQ